ncbi:MAG: GNAT family N-acetyltransferase [Planctomycetota bacterium]
MKPVATGSAGGQDTASGLPTHDVYPSYEAAADLQVQWDAFVESVGGDLFATYDWGRVWWKHYGDGRRLELHVFGAKNEIVGIVPLFRERLRIGPVSARVVRLVGCDHSVTTTSLAVAREHARVVMAGLVAKVTSEKPWDLLHLGPLGGYLEDSGEITEAIARCDGLGEIKHEIASTPHIVFDLPTSYDEYLKKLSADERSNVRRRERRFFSDQAGNLVAVAASDLEENFPRFVTQHQAQWQAQGQQGHFADWPQSQPFHREMSAAQAKHGRLMLLRLDAGDRIVGYQYSIGFGRRAHWIIGSRDLDRQWDFYSPGRMLLCMSLRNAIERGCTQLDAMRGMYDYKLKLAGRITHSTSIWAVRRGSSSRRRTAFLRAAARMLHLGYYRIWFNRVSPHVPRLRGPLWKTWIRSRI